uniref:Uncharacterized protein n=1 Tax=Arundo donax TaxID=35708 RepID=A0A0A9GTL6_ARUDO
MALSLLAAASPFLLYSSSRRPVAAAPTRRAALRVAALKYDPSKVGGRAAVTQLVVSPGFWVGF